MMKQFFRYFSVGIINTIIHWGVFYLFYRLTYIQSLSNLIGFSAAVIFSFFVNSKYTFEKEINIIRMVFYVSFMGLMSYLIGLIADKIEALPAITLIISSGISLILGFLYSRYIIFRNKK
ncbi:GtrA family protein [Aggregatibacter actinomycetemcomitans]|uniref:GtrA family protein n=2 Tax=Aggregatibacter actinomycetemcomitans TaxID=714 RepID=UPI0005184ABF|nr:GtrA family protein [Aggregatibacter actinomycetemcomitans]KYK81493.1 translocase [Aggregatibacter actinomycetemcomitans serotype e str. SC936]TYB21788.1 GtrA family protein [Aggregatibacter actinomycetemcomitans]